MTLSKQVDIIFQNTILNIIDNKFLHTSVKALKLFKSFKILTTKEMMTNFRIRVCSTYLRTFSIV
jgi:hypothetical protein